MKVNVTVSAKDDAEKSEKPENNAVQEATNGQEFGEERKDVLPEQSDAHTSETKNKNVPTIDDKDGNENNIVSVNKKPDEPASQVNVNLVQTTDVRNVSMQGKDAIGNVTENSEQEGFIIELGETEKKEDGKEKSEDTIQTLSLQDPERKEEKGGNITEAEPEVRHDGEEGKQEEIVEEEIQESRNASGHEQGNQDGVDMNEEKKENDGEADGDRKEEVIKVQHDREGESLKNSTESNGENIEESREEEALQVQSNDTKEMKPEEHVEESSNDSGNEGEATGANRNEESKEQNHEPIVDDMDEGKESALRDDSIFQTKDNEAETATKEVEMQLEALKRDSEMETTVQQAHERDPSDDDYDIIQELTDLPTKLQETAGKVAEHLRPDVIKWKDTSKVYFDLANQQIRDSFSPLVGRQYAPFFASMISYGILLLPLIIVIMLFDHIKALFSLQKVLLFVNIYLAAYFATLWLASFIIGLEPMSFFYFNSLSSYISLQLLQALGYLIYLILQTTNVVYSCTSDTLAGKVNSSLQWVVAMVIGLHYYVTVFHPAVTSKPPHTSWKFYAMYTVAFFFLCLFARIRWVKKPYVTSGNSISDKKS
ncbi:hypothetical protein KP509_03G038700 [Ceratopteris richardii]|nr:hypothetical protein KP509_03G038700 [Ceratopteris richardii]